MKSTAHLHGHPIHPMLIPYPFALLSSAAAFDVAAAATRRPEYSQTAAHLTDAGLAAGVAAAVPGLVDYFGSVPPRSSARKTATIHALCNVSALACFALTRARRDDGDRLPNSSLALSLIGTALLSLGGWLGGTLVYREHIAVVEDGSAQLPAARESIRRPEQEQP